MGDRRSDSLFKRFENLEAERRQFEATWQKIADHELGRRNFTSHPTVGGSRRDVDLYDTTAQQMASLLASGLHSLLTNPATEWFHIKPMNEEMLQNHDVAGWFEQVELVMRGAFNLPKARFSSQVHEAYIDLVSFGTAGLYVGDEPGYDRVLFSARPLNELYVSEDPAGNIDTVFRKFQYSHRQAVKKWGSKAPEMCQKAMETGATSEEKHEFLHLVMPADEPIKIPFSNTPMPFASTYMDYETKKIIDEGGFHELPYMVARWEKDAGETYGRGPGWNALADAKMSSTMKKTAVQAGQMAVRPPVMTEDDGVATQLDLRPGGRNVVRASGVLNPPIQPIDFRPRMDIGVELIRDTRKQVQEAFLWELLQLIRDPRMTATQVLEISANVQRVLSPILGRIQTELLEPIIERVYAIMLRRGMFPDPPRELEGQEFMIEYVSPVARAQRQSDTQAIVDLYTFSTNLSQVDPSVLDVLNSEEALRFMAQQRGVPISVLRSRDEVGQMRQAQAAAEAEAQRKQDAIAAVDAAAKLAPAMDSMAGLEGTVPPGGGGGVPV